MLRNLAKATKICRVCGNKYEACRTSKVSNTFRWQDVSCSPKCGTEYLRRIRLSREALSTKSVMYNEEVNGFDSEPDEEYITEFGSDE